jgi:hypothetical protein
MATIVVQPGILGCRSLELGCQAVVVACGVDSLATCQPFDNFARSASPAIVVYIYKSAVWGSYSISRIDQHRAVWSHPLTVDSTRKNLARELVAHITATKGNDTPLAQRRHAYDDRWCEIDVSAA